MNTTVRKTLFLMLMCIASVGCSQTGPASTNETSAARPELADRIQFVESYVNFKRTYEDLDYAIRYHNNSGGLLPAPSDWDIRLIALVPKAELDAWIPADSEQSETPLPKWLDEVPGKIERSGITTWYRQGGRMVGLDRERSIVAYRNTTTP